MKLKYMGPKEVISAHGISFKRGKDDKYVYIYPAMQIFNAIHHDYEKDKNYEYSIKGDSLSDEELLNIILSLKPNLQEKVIHSLEDINNYLNEEISNVEEHKEYNKEEQLVYKKNLEIMREYRIQRETNKVIYKALIEIIVDDIFEKRLKVINAPFNEKYWHILQTIQGELSNHNKRSIGSTLDIVHKEEVITISLKINSIGK